MSANNGFKPLYVIDQDSSRFGLRQIANHTLRIGDMSMAVELPKGENLNEWLAVNTIEFFNEISLLFGCLTEFCNKETCPTMSAGPKYEYLWADGTSVKKAMKVSAAEYIDFLMTWVDNQIHNETLFPSQPGIKFPSNFLKTIKIIFKRLFRVYAHIYHSHFNQILMLEAEPHLNTSFKHFIFFIDEFKLAEEKDLEPLAELIQEFLHRKKVKKNQNE